jgi:hypothetical protein
VQGGLPEGVIAVEQQRCRRCGCVVGQQAYEKNGVRYCCQSCAERFECECGCISEYDSG